VGGTTERTFARPLKAALAALFLSGLLALVMLGSRGSHPGGDAQLHQREVPAQAANDLLTIIVIVYVVGFLALIAIAYWLRGEGAKRKKSRWLSQLVFLCAFVIGIALAVNLVRGRLQNNLHGVAPPAVTNPVTKQRTPTLPDRPVARRPAQLDWVLVALIGGGLVLAAVIIRARRRQPEGELEEEQTVQEELSAVVGDAIDDLRREPDARRAVIAAYARMERVLAQHGHPRSVSEAPFEYLGRVLLRLRVRATAVSDLTELFERAKFSTHEIDAPMKERAIAALVSVRDDLEAATA